MEFCIAMSMIYYLYLYDFNRLISALGTRKQGGPLLITLNLMFLLEGFTTLLVA